MNLYEIDREIERCFEIDPETGEILNADKLDALQMDKERKIENLACYIKNLKAEEAAFSAEKKALSDRDNATKAKRERLENYLFGYLNGEKFSSAKCAISFRRTPERVEIADESAIPAQYFREQVVKAPDKNAIKAALKNGESIAGCALVSSLSMSVK